MQYVDASITQLAMNDLNGMTIPHPVIGSNGGSGCSTLRAELSHTNNSSGGGGGILLLLLLILVLVEVEVIICTHHRIIVVVEEEVEVLGIIQRPCMYPTITVVPLIIITALTIIIITAPAIIIAVLLQKARNWKDQQPKNHESSTSSSSSNNNTFNTNSNTNNSTNIPLTELFFEVKIAKHD